MNIMKVLIISLTISVFFPSCKSERYRKDKSNRLSSKADKANDFHAKQAVKLTQNNIDKKEKNERKSVRRKRRLQTYLNELNSRQKRNLNARKPKQFNLY